MTIAQINVSRGGLPKRSIPEAEVNSLGIVGDEHAHPQIHGGPRQALLLITAEAIEELIQRGFPLFHGALGENITARGLDYRSMRPGQRYRIGQILIELTQQREPCSQLDNYGPGIQEAVRAIPGYYAAVLRGGTIRPGDPIQLLEELA